MDDIVKGEVGLIQYDLDLKDGKLLLNIALPLDVALDKLKGVIPGSTDDAIIDVVKVILKGL